MSDTHPPADEAAAGQSDAGHAASGADALGAAPAGQPALAGQPMLTDRPGAGDPAPAAEPAGAFGPRDVLALVVESVGLVAQLVLLALGGFFISTEDEDAGVLALIGWCLVGTLYVFVTVVWMNIEVRGSESGSRPIRWILLHPLARVLSTTGAFIASIVGLWCAIELIFNPDWHDGIDLFAVWAMLLAWALFHWGFARIYFARFYKRADAPPLEFPKTPSPQLGDFVYFSFTNATNFSVSDVMVTDRRMRWTVIWHTTISFFFNALIIVLSINTITSGGFGGE